jgi:hypothetical protein
MATALVTANAGQASMHSGALSGIVGLIKKDPNPPIVLIRCPPDVASA